jgi:glycosyltransferase involved in cell wall biosynthesis
MARRLRRMAPDVVHSFLYTDAAAARLAHRPYILSVGGIALRSSFAGQRLKLRLFELARSGAAAIVCPSQAAARHLRDEYGHDAEVIPNGLDVERFRVDLQRRPGRIFCAATPNDNRKRPHVLVEAFGILAERGIDAELVFAGAVSASRRDELLHRLPEPVRNRVSFAGEVAEDEVVRLYAGSTVTCLPSLNEAFGMVVVESLAAGTPVVGTDHGAIPELLSAEVGRMFAPDDPDACASGLQHFLELESSAALQMACRARAAAFDWSVVGPRFLDLYRRVLERQAVAGTLPKKNE